MFLNKQQLKDLRAHLTCILHKYSDADSSILSDYIVALLSKDGSKVQIRKDCCAELSAFMNDKTQQFVEELFNFINNELFKTSNPPNPSNPTPPDRPRPRTKHTRRVEVHSKSSKRDNLVITRDVNQSSNTKKPIESQSAPQQHDFVVNTPSRSPSKSMSPKRSRITHHHSHNNGNHHNNNTHYRPNRRRTHHADPKAHTNQKANPANLEALTQLLGLVQQNIQNAQYQSQNKAFRTRRSLNNNAALGLLAPYVARPIIQRTAGPTPNLIVTSNPSNAVTTAAKKTSNLVSNRVANVNSATTNNSNILDRRLDELRLPPNNNPFYQDDRFARQNINNNNHRGRGGGGNMRGNYKNYRGKKRTFSKMNDESSKFERTELSSKRQVYVFNIPSHLNTMTHLTSHFEQFGDIQHIQVHRDNNKAFVQFSSHNEAMDALNSPDPILNDTTIQCVWAHYNRRDFERNAAKHSENQKQDIQMKENETQEKAEDIGGTVSMQWISKEYKEKVTHERPAKKQKVSTSEEIETVKIPCDVSENIETLKGRLHETLKMYETLETEEDNADVFELKETLKKTIQSIENQLKKLIIHQKKRQQMLMRKEEKDATKNAWRGGRGRGRGRWRGRGRGRGRGLGRGRWRGRGRGRGRGRRGGGYRGGYRGRGYRGRGASYVWRGSKHKKVKTKNVSVDYRSSSLMIDNLPPNADEHELRVHFLKFGAVQSIDLLPHQNGAKVRFEKRSDAISAMNKGKEFKSNQLKVKFTEIDDANTTTTTQLQQIQSKNDEKDNNELMVYQNLPQAK